MGATKNKARLTWQTTKISPWQRQTKIFSIAFKLLFGLWQDSLNKSAKRRQKRAKWLVDSLLELGPTFIKIGQALSTRADLIPIEYVQEFSMLQDRVPAFDSEIAVNIIETELGKSVRTLFRDFNTNPLAAASLGQVHKARLHTGEDIVVKVQRPGLEELFNLDFELLHHLVRLGNQYFKNLRKYNLEEIYQEFFELLFQEVDYINEGKNAERFQQNFLGYQRVKVPKIYWDYTTRKILTLEYLPGIKIDDRAALEANNIDTQQIIQLGITCYLKQLLQDGFFQSDPHPGNMAVNGQGEIIFYDFGTMAEVKSMAQDRMIRTFFAMLKKDTETVVECLVYMGLINPMPDMTPVKRLVSFALENFLDRPIDVRAFEQVGSEIYIMFEQQPFRLPAQMTFIIKSVTTLDGIARALDPEYSLLAAAKPFVKNMAVSNNKGNLIGTLARSAKDFIQYKLNQPNPTELAIRRLESRLEFGELQIRVKSIDSDRTLKRIQLAIKNLIYTCLTGFTMISGTLLLIANYPNWAIVLFCISGCSFLLLLRSSIDLAMKEKLDKLVQK
jgi:predicted unusual protein kinase regulating ubiquinone biosynthesis (AarF/ABC1/UbiB family)